jgi:hypothetical protein
VPGGSLLGLKFWTDRRPILRNAVDEPTSELKLRAACPLWTLFGPYAGAGAARVGPVRDVESVSFWGTRHYARNQL